MTLEFRCKSDFKNSMKVRNLFPNLHKSLRNGQNLREIAQAVLKSEKGKDNFSKYSIETLVKFIKGSFVGGEFKSFSFEGSFEDTSEYSEIVGKRKNQKGLQGLIEKGLISIWSQEEIDFIIKDANNRLTPKEIYSRFSQIEEFKRVEYKTFESKYWDLKRTKKIKTRNRIDWNSEIGDWGIYFKNRYGSRSGSYSQYAFSLNEYFFNNEEIITKSKLSNFYEREKNK